MEATITCSTHPSAEGTILACKPDTPNDGNIDNDNEVSSFESAASAVNRSNIRQFFRDVSSLGGGFASGGGTGRGRFGGSCSGSACLPSEFAGVLLVATLLTPIPGDELLGAYLLSGGLRFATRSSLRSRSVFFVNRRGTVFRNRHDAEMALTNRAFARAGVASAGAGAVTGLGGAVNSDGDLSTTLRCASVGALGAGIGSLTLSLGGVGGTLSLGFSGTIIGVSATGRELVRQQLSPCLPVT